MVRPENLHGDEEPSPVENPDCARRERDIRKGFAGCAHGAVMRKASKKEPKRVIFLTGLMAGFFCSETLELFPRPLREYCVEGFPFMKNVLVAWNELADQKKWSSFKSSLIDCLTDLDEAGFETDEEHISFISYKERLDDLVARQSGCDLLICGENFDGTRIGTGTIRRWKQAKEGLNAILVLDDSKKGSSKVMGLFELDYFNALFMSDFKSQMIKNLVREGRTKEEAFLYYGLEDYIDLRKKPKRQLEEVAKDKTEDAGYTEEIAGAKEDVIPREEEDPLRKYPDEATLSDEEAQIYRYIKNAEEKGAAEVKPEVPETVVERVLELLLEYYTRIDTSVMSNLERGLLEREDWDRDVWQRINQYENLEKEEKREIYQRFSAFMWGQDILEPFINDVTVSDIKCLSPDNIRIKRQGKRETAANVRFRSKDHYMAFVSHLVKRNNATLDQAIVRFVDEKSSKHAKLRTNISTEFIITTGYPVVHFRLVPKEKYNTMQLINAGMFSPYTAKYLIDAVKEKRGLIICGQNAAGKSTLMNWAIDFIPHEKSVYCIQESPELEAKNHPEFVSVSPREQFANQRKLTASEEEKVAVYALKDLTVNSLLTDNDYIIIGEIKNEEARYFTNAAYTGSVCWATVHASNARGALPKIADYAVAKSKDDANFSYTKEDLLQMMTSLEVIVYVEGFEVKEICEVTGWDAEKKELCYRDIHPDKGTTESKKKRRKA